MPTLRRGALSLFLAGILLAGCAPLGKEPQEGRTALSDELIDELLRQTQNAGQQFYSLEGLAKVQVVRQGKKNNLNQALHIERPDRLRAETLNPFGFGSPVLLMATDGHDLAVLIPGEGLVLRGAASAQNLQRFLELPLQVSDLVDFLLYQARVIPAQHQDGSLGPMGDYRLDLFAADGRRQELLLSKDKQLLETAYYQDDNLVLRVRYDQFGEEVPHFPRVIQITMPQRQTEVSLTYNEISINLPLSATLFQLATPPGYKERPFPGDVDGRW